MKLLSKLNKFFFLFKFLCGLCNTIFNIFSPFNTLRPFELDMTIEFIDISINYCSLQSTAVAFDRTSYIKYHIRRTSAEHAIVLNLVIRNYRNQSSSSRPGFEKKRVINNNCLKTILLQYCSSCTQLYRLVSILAAYFR